MCVLPCFSERKTRLDKYGDYQVKIIWSTNTTVGPTNYNWAKKEWAFDTAIQYHYILNPKNSSGISQAIVAMYYDYNVPSYQKKYAVEVTVLKEGVQEDIAFYSYYSNEYNLAKYTFDVSVNSSLNYSTHSPRILKGVISMFQGSSLFQSSAV